MTRAVEHSHPVICADGGLRIFTELNRICATEVFPDVLIGDLDSLEGLPKNTTEKLKRSGTRIIREWIGQVDKDDTDGQLAVAYAMAKYGCQRILLYGALPRPDDYELDHFLGNLQLMRLGAQLSQVNADPERSWNAEMRDPLQTIHFVVSEITLERKNDGIQRVSLIAEESEVRVAKSTNLRWGLDGLHVDPVKTNALRNEFVTGANHATIRLAEGSDPVYVIHNWYE